jgi:septum formation protein
VAEPGRAGTGPRVVLASASPRRRELLDTLGLRFVVSPSDIDESEHAGEDPIAYVQRLAIEKAAAAGIAPVDIVIAADTTVDVDGQILGKPADDADARRMLTMLGGRTHRVHTGVAIAFGGRLEAAVETTVVTMVPITAAAMDWYVGTGEPHGKAGAYAIQGAGALLVSSVHGSVTNVIGLPLTVVDRLITRLGLSLPGLIAAR